MQKPSAPSPRLRRTLWAGLLVLVLGLALFEQAMAILQS